MRDPFALEFRRARLEDLAKLSRLERRVWAELAGTYGELRRRFLCFPGAFQVAALGPEIVGFCSAFLTDRDATQAEMDENFPPVHERRGPYFFLLGLTVNPLYRRRGIGSGLVARELELARRLGCRKVQSIANAYSEGLFRRFGFFRVRPLPLVFQEYPRLMPQPVLMELELEEARRAS